MFNAVPEAGSALSFALIAGFILLDAYWRDMLAVADCDAIHQTISTFVAGDLRGGWPVVAGSKSRRDLWRDGLQLWSGDHRKPDD
jgi:hypothetical protein